MNTAWLVDIVLLLGLVFLAALALQLNRQQTWIDSEELPDSAEDDKKGGFSLYPQRLIRNAGFVPSRVKLFYWFGKVLLALLIPLAIMELNVNAPAFVYIAFSVLAFFAPDIWLWQRMKKRQARIEYALSYFLDLTIAFLLSGMSLDAAIRQAALFGLPAKNPLRQELGLVTREIDAGRNREEAYNSLWHRTGVSDLQSLVNVFRVGFHLGSPVVSTLESHADLLRFRLHEKGMKRINFKTVVAMVPMILLNFPIMGLLVFFPPLVEMSRAFPLFDF